MKFGKTIQSQQVPGWGGYYLNYKALKKIINSYAAGRPASDASLLSLGLRLSKKSPGSGKSDAETGSISPPPPPPPPIPTTTLEDLEPLPAESEPPAPNTGSALMSRHPTGGNDKSESFKAHRDVFFFTLQRELEKINTFYLIKERDLRLRLLTLLSNRKRLLQNSNGSGTNSSDNDLDGNSRKDAEWTSLEEGWRLFERDLGKLQGFIEINATGFRKILKKWDKRSKSNTKELYIERQVEVQPCFNREFIAKLSDIVAANLLDLENGSEHLSTSFLERDLPDSIGADGLNFNRKEDYDSDAGIGNSLALDALVDLESNMVKALTSGKEAVSDWLKLAKTKQHRDKGRRLMRILWRAALQVPSELLDLVLSAIKLDYDYIDNINGRSPLHQACIAGSSRLVQLCVENNHLLLEKPDAYDRKPIHYAAIHGHPEIVSFLLSKSADPSATDMDGYTPLMHAIIQGHLEVVRIFVQDKITLEPTAISNDLIPLSLACQFGHLEVARLLLQCGAKVIPNSEGLYPQHFAAKAGHEAICRLLVDEGGKDGGGRERQDKYNLWTPLHHAAIGGESRHLACMKVLVEAGCDVNTSDDYGKSPGWYSAWFGHVECLNFLLDNGAKLNGKQNTLEGMENLGLSADPQMDSLSPGSDLELDPPQDEFELIPSLSLPPPIIPLRVYGHEFLANRCLVQLSLGHPFSRPSSIASKAPPIKLYSRSGQDSLHLWSSLKLVMTSKSDITAVPHSVILPLADEREVFSFQVQSLERFTLELSLYPTFGSKVIGRAIVLPDTFNDITYHKGIVAPLLDHNLKTIGEVAFEVSCIKPFEGAQLEIGGRVETYWKSKVTPSQPTQDHAHQFQSHRPLSVSTTSPSLRPPVTAPPASNNNESALVTASSLSGEYVHIVIQVTKDFVPVIYSKLKLPIEQLDIAVSDVTCDQFLSIAKSNNLLLTSPSNHHLTSGEWSELLSTKMSTLDNVLSILPPEIGLNLLLQYLRPATAIQKQFGRSIEINKFVDTILHSIYQSGKNNPGRKIIFSSFEPEVATALNWKQPNYAVFFASYCGISSSPSSTDSSGRTRLSPLSLEEESDLRCLSVREAVNFAKSTNLLGVILEATTLAAVPSLVASVKDAGLLLATFGDSQDVTALRQGASDGRTVDAFVIDGIMTLTI
ncbi:uncharacterized protein IL334_006366 [Kwoniella shivajii]|uniref:Cyclin-dependent protein kinase inhibitor n=1 Tax=Kwoniella shivajii TaxID=564305 RepID=A0ABZ1D5S2_9TREE|nr:hypothetical protein IL334_006366 [Kwoniella shivajii]